MFAANKTHSLLLNAGPMMRLCFLQTSPSAATRFIPQCLRQRSAERRKARRIVLDPRTGFRRLMEPLCPAARCDLSHHIDVSCVNGRWAHEQRYKRQWCRFRTVHRLEKMGVLNIYMNETRRQDAHQYDDVSTQRQSRGSTMSTE